MLKSGRRQLKDRRTWRDLVEKAKNPQRVVVTNGDDDDEEEDDEEVL